MLYWQQLDEFTASYCEAALWASPMSFDDDTSMSEHFGVEDIDGETLIRMARSCDVFRAEAGDLLDGIDPMQAGHDFWLTRNRHGAGFWDRGLGEIGDKLTRMAHTYGERHLYVRHGKVYQH